jgi:hypothetical protein
VCTLIFLLDIWLLISPMENHSLYHWEIIIGFFVLIFILLFVEYFLKKSKPSNLGLFIYESFIVVGIWSLWYFIVG